MMKPIRRSMSGLTIALVGLPVFLGLVACLPVPIGNPEKSRIDPYLTGMWIKDSNAIVLLEPYDKRTWLLSYIDISRDFDNCKDIEERTDPAESPAESPAEESDREEVVIEADESPDDDYLELVARLDADTSDCYGTEAVSLYKVWRSEFGKRPFLTWEPMGAFDEDLGFVKPIWYGFLIDRIDADNFHLWMIDIDTEPFEGIKALEELGDAEPPFDPRASRSAQRAIEKVLRRNADNEDIYEGGSLQFRRVRAEDTHLFYDLVEEVVKVDP